MIQPFPIGFIGSQGGPIVPTPTPVPPTPTPVPPTPTPTSAAPTIITNSLHLWAGAFDTASYPGSGTTLYAISPTIYDGTLVNGVSYDGTDPKSLVTDGIDDYVNFGDSSAGSNTVNWTWGAWVKFATVAQKSFWQRGVDVVGQAGGWSLMVQVKGGGR